MSAVIVHTSAGGNTLLNHGSHKIIEGTITGVETTNQSIAIIGNNVYAGEEYHKVAGSNDTIHVIDLTKFIAERLTDAATNIPADAFLRIDNPDGTIRKIVIGNPRTIYENFLADAILYSPIKINPTMHKDKQYLPPNSNQLGTPSHGTANEAEANVYSTKKRFSRSGALLINAVRGSGDSYIPGVLPVKSQLKEKPNMREYFTSLPDMQLEGIFYSPQYVKEQECTNSKIGLRVMLFIILAVIILVIIVVQYLCRDYEMPSIPIIKTT
jgi:hypothetical protein